MVWSGEQGIQLVGILAGVFIGLLFLYFPPLEVAKLLLVLGAVVVLAGNYFLGLLLIPFALPFLPNLAYTMLLALVLGSFLLRVLLDRKLQLRVPANPFMYILLGLFFLSGVSSITLGYSLREFVLHCLGWGIVLALTSSLTQRRRLKIFLMAMVLAAVLVSLYGIYGYFIGVPGESGWVDAEMHPELTTRAYSTFGNPNVLAEYLVFVLPFSLALAWYQRDWSLRLLYGGATALQVLCLVLTMSRSGWLAFAAGMAVFAVLLDRRLLLVGLGLGVLALPVLLRSDVFLQRLLSIFSLKDSSNAHRIVVWQETLVMIRNFWATGVGLGHRAFRFLYPYFAFDRSKYPFHSHNTYLQVAVETGLFGLAALLLYLGSILKGAVRRIFVEGHPFDRTMLVAATSSLAGILVFGLFESVLYLPKIIIMFWTVVGITLTLLEIRGSSFEIRNGE